MNDRGGMVIIMGLFQARQKIKQNEIKIKKASDQFLPHILLVD
jgi:hypothetical protein